MNYPGIDHETSKGTETLAQTMAKSNEAATHEMENVQIDNELLVTGRIPGDGN